MTPYEKAIRLIQKMEGLVARPFDGKSNILLNPVTKERAIICVDEIIQELEPDDLFKNYNERVTYWRDVKEEISKL